jgi:hypothetical protein
MSGMWREGSMQDRVFETVSKIIQNGKCKCGCGKRIKKGRTYLHGHYWGGKKLSKETREKIGKSHMGEKHYNWKKDGEKVVNRNGYVLVYFSNHSSGKRKIFEHWLVIEKYFGRFPKGSEETHHVNEIKTDNRAKNLMLFKTEDAHKRFHRMGDRGVKKNEILFDGRDIV